MAQLERSVATGAGTMKVPLGCGTTQAFPVEWDVVYQMWVTIHADNGCKRCKGTGRVLPPASRPAPAAQGEMAL